jgi:transglutaminase-like putative cysteine protease
VFLEVEHHLWLEYDAFINESVVELRLQPKTLSRQAVAAFLLAVGPPATMQRYRDWNDNLVHHFTITKYHDRIEVLSRSLVDTRPSSPALAAIDDPTPLATPLPPHLEDWLALGGPLSETPRLRRFSAGVKTPRNAPLGALVRDLSEHVQRHFKYEKNVTRYDSTTDDFLRLGAGVCQDFAHMMLALLRLRGIPCRYVSGYLHIERESVEPSQSHAWIEFHAPTHGWVGFDPTHHRDVDERYVVVAHGRHYDDVPPNKGLYRGNAHETLRAEVRTRPTARKTVSDVHEEIRHIDLPVYQEIPERPAARPYSAADEVAAQQQQQQQR